MAPRQTDRTPPTILFASANDSDYRSLTDAIDQRDVRLLHAHTFEEAARCLAAKPGLPVVIADRDLPMGGWFTLLRRIETLPNPPRLVVCSRLADDRLWAEVLNLGGFDVLATPFCREEVSHVIHSARDHWTRSLPASQQTHQAMETMAFSAA